MMHTSFVGNLGGIKEPLFKRHCRKTESLAWDPCTFLVKRTGRDYSADTVVYKFITAVGTN